MAARLALWSASSARNAGRISPDAASGAVTARFSVQFEGSLRCGAAGGRPSGAMQQLSPEVITCLRLQSGRGVERVAAGELLETALSRPLIDWHTLVKPASGPPALRMRLAGAEGALIAGALKSCDPRLAARWREGVVQRPSTAAVARRSTASSDVTSSAWSSRGAVPSGGR
jgi:hypothetical protein